MQGKTTFIQTFHLKAIELVAKFVPSSTHYINHLIGSFNKNYKSNMDSIVNYCLLRTNKTLLLTLMYSNLRRVRKKSKLFFMFDRKRNHKK